MQALHRAVAILGVIACCAALPIALRRRHVAAGFAVAVLLALLGNAAITGGLSGPHDRYQSRIMWLAPLTALLATASLFRSPARAAPPVAPVLARRPPGRRSPADRNRSMNRAHASNVFWSGLEAASAAALSFASAFVIARLVGPSEVGIGAAVVAVHVLLWVAVNALFADPLVQRAVGG